MSTQSPRETSAARPATRGGAGLLVAAGLLAVVLAAHGATLFDGVVFDDHWHRATLRNGGWSFQDMVESATFDLPGQLNHLWWQTQPLQWRYARPAAMFFMKLEYLLVGGNPIGIHAFGLLWHWLAGLLVYRLASWAIGARKWAFLAAMLFLIHPHAVFAVSWTAARNALVSGCFFVAAVLAYIVASRPEGAAREGVRPLTSSGGLPPSWLKGLTPAALRPGMLAVSLALWGVALLARETAIIFPLVVLAADATFGGCALVRRRLPVHALIWLLAAGYLAWRLLVFPVSGVPEVYFRSPQGLSYVPWAASKLLQMLFAMVCYSPMFAGVATTDGFGAGGGLRHGLMLHALMLAVVLAPFVLYAVVSRGARGRWLWPIWLLGAFLPVIPVFILPHFAYLPAVAYAVMLAALLRHLRGRWQVMLTIFVVASMAWPLGVYRFAWRGVARCEQLIYADVIEAQPRPEPGAKLFFINLPLVGIYAPVAAREAWGLEDVTGYVLTFAPGPLRAEQPCVVKALGDRELLVRLSEGVYFAGPTGSMLLQMTRPDGPLTAGQLIPGELFDTTVVEADARGVTSLKFTFREPLASRRYHFYVSSPQRPAARLRFDAPPEPLDAQTAALFARAQETDTNARMEARRRIAAIAEPVAVQTASEIQSVLRADPRLVADDHLRRVEAWWRAADVPRLAAQSRAWRQSHAADLRQSEYYFAVFRLTRRLVRSDLFLTGGGEPAED